MLQIALIVSCQQWGDVIAQLKDSALANDARRTLLAAEPASYLLDLKAALSLDPGFAEGTIGMLEAYRVLSSARSVEILARKPEKRIVLPDHLDLLDAGLQSMTYQIRELAVESLQAWVSSRRALALVRLDAALKDESPRVRIAACASAARFGGEASGCLPELESLLVSTISEKSPEYWIQLTGPNKYKDDLSFDGRVAAAYARTRVAGIASNRQIYDVVDNQGKDAIAVAWAQFLCLAIGEQMAHDPLLAPFCDSMVQVLASENLLLIIVQEGHLSRLEDSMSNIVLSSIAAYIVAGVATPTFKADLGVYLDSITTSSLLSDAESQAVQEIRQLARGT